MPNKKLKIKVKPGPGITAAQWEKSATWIVETMISLSESPTGHGLKWTTNMILHYNSKYIELRTHTPKRCRGIAASFDEVVAKILEKYPPLK